MQETPAKAEHDRMHHIMVKILVLCILILSSCTQTRNRTSTYSQPKAASTPRKVVSTSTPAINKTTGDVRKDDRKHDTGHRKSVTPSPDVSGYYDPEDFYEWYSDDFSDYEEAEAYYYENGGW